MRLTQLQQQLLLAVSQREKIDPKNMELVEEYRGLERAGYIKLHEKHSSMEAARPLYLVVATLTAEGEDAVRQIRAAIGS